MSDTLVIGERVFTIEDVNSVAIGFRQVQISNSPEFVNKINENRQTLLDILNRDGQVYGVTTGYGDSCTTAVTENFYEELPLNLTRFHRCGMGEVFNEAEVRSIMLVRLASLAQGRSGVRYELLTQIAALLNHRIYPRMPSEGSVGASGDLTPLSYLAAALIGEGEVYYKGEMHDAKSVLNKYNLLPFELKSKEALAIMNGTAAMTGLASQAYLRAEYLCQLASRITSLMSISLLGNAFHFDEVLFAAKPHRGQNQIAQFVRSDLIETETPSNSKRLQDRYSIRCAPHVIGVLQDALPFFRQWIEVEINSSNDNPLIDTKNKRILHGGHFYGGHIAFAMDSMKNAIANIADLIDRQMALLVDTKFNQGLPPNLIGTTGPRQAINHGFKAVQVGMSAWTAEALKLTMPASVFSRSTECHNQDKVSMGTIAARDCMRILQLTEQVAAAALAACAQAYEIRIKNNEIHKSEITPAIQAFVSELKQDFSFLTEDRPLEGELRQLTENIQRQKWALYNFR